MRKRRATLWMPKLRRAMLMPLTPNARRSKRRRWGVSGRGEGALVISLLLHHTRGITPCIMLKPIRNPEARPACPAHLSIEKVVFTAQELGRGHPRLPFRFWLLLNLNHIQRHRGLCKETSQAASCFYNENILPFPPHILYYHDFCTKGSLEGLRELTGKRARVRG